jgi:hypothetical protein
MLGPMWLLTVAWNDVETHCTEKLRELLNNREIWFHEKPQEGQITVWIRGWQDHNENTLDFHGIPVIRIVNA